MRFTEDEGEVVAEVTNLVDAVSRLRIARTSSGRPVRHQGLVLLWAIGRALAGAPTQARWGDVADDLRSVFARYGDPDSDTTPQYPFIALHGGSFWHLGDFTGVVPSAHGSAPLAWLTEQNPTGALRPEVRVALTDDRTRGRLVGALLNRFFDGERTVGPMLSALRVNRGEVTRDGRFALIPGDVVRRTELHQAFGGQEQGGISMPRNSPFVFLFSTPGGDQFGYRYDGAQSDGSYRYTGQGTNGDQRFTAANRAVLERSAHVFEQVAKGVVQYVGEFLTDPQQSYTRADAPDEAGELRTVPVFRLNPVGGDQVRPSRGQPVVDVVPARVDVRVVDLEAHRTASSTRTPGTGEITAERREAKLVRAYAEWLARRGGTAKAQSISVPGRAGRLRTDLFHVEADELVESKRTASSQDVRLALGQLLDYRRYVKPARMAVLVPVRPADDLVELLAEHGIGCVYPLGEGFERAADAHPVE